MHTGAQAHRHTGIRNTGRQAEDSENTSRLRCMARHNLKLIEAAMHAGDS